ncbi:hypothetical protein ADIARSV_3184 [Arcticibacter svalbardensis MN12-7]|uniref:Thioredoxin domain-containing protein n=1 Tax=Arcticibacter svalbardensis MN12-7 TaxID=1150600 RepID=R9GXI0_9SPHI|nr:thioredoxin family protein [Arcticibacter svalbardensis]EOR93644.1 hypothetical protein ADIARSV_3184 [Arcticibacter svalbardensis MN12-7]
MKKTILTCLLLFTGYLTVKAYLVSQRANASRIEVNAMAEGYSVGSVVEDFTLKNVDNKDVKLSDYSTAKGFIVVFTCNTCPVAKAYQDRVVALNAEYASKGYPVIAINTNDPVASPGDTFEKMQERAKEKSFSFPYLQDVNQVVTKQFGAAHTPTVFILKKTDQGNVVKYMGAIDNDQDESNPTRSTFVKNAVDDLIQGKSPAITTTKAIGCSVKWKKA